MYFEYNLKLYLSVNICMFFFFFFCFFLFVFFFYLIILSLYVLLRRVIKPGFHGQFFFDKVGFLHILVYTEVCGEVSLSNICDKGERAK